jgi:hypothetical protein
LYPAVGIEHEVDYQPVMLGDFTLLRPVRGQQSSAARSYDAAASDESDTASPSATPF